MDQVETQIGVMRKIFRGAGDNIRAVVPTINIAIRPQWSNGFAILSVFEGTTLSKQKTGKSGMPN